MGVYFPSCTCDAAAAEAARPDALLEDGEEDEEDKTGDLPNWKTWKSKEK